jgi:two-component system, sensor histidine kinase
MMFKNTDLAPEEHIARLEKINKALMGRVERSLDFQGGAFSLFQTAILLEDKVRARTRDLEDTLSTLSSAYSHLEEARDDAEMAKQNLTAAIEAVSEGFALFDSAEKLVMCNAQFRSVMPDAAWALDPGYGFEMIAKAFSESPHLVLPENASRMAWHDQRLEIFRKPHASFIQQYSGDRWLQVSNRKMTTGATVIFQTDITDTVRSERIKHERELDEQAKLLRATIDHLPQGICMFSRTLELKTWNRSLVELLPVPLKLLAGQMTLGRVFRILDDAAFELDESAAAKMGRWLQNPAASDLSGVEMQRSDGVILSVDSNAMPDGGIVVTFMDVTEERKARLALKIANETLEQRVTERTSELRLEVDERRAIEAQLVAAKEEAEAANKGKTQFLAAASHDLLQPLNASRIFLSLLQETELNSRQTRFVDNADRAFGSVEQLLESLLDISRFETRSVQTNVVAIDLNQILFTLVSEFQPVADRKGLKLRYVATRLWVKSDPGLLRRIIQNLVSNAIRYTDKGKVLIGARRRGTSVLIEVWDTGPGIPEGKREVIFEEFRQLHSEHSREGKAMGLGLAIVDRVAKLLGHRVLLRSRINAGSCFALDVPLSEPAVVATRVSAPAQERRKSKRKPTIIVVENDLQILEGMIELLQAKDLNAIPTVSAEEALEVLDTLEFLPNLIIADYHLDMGTGLDAVRRLRAVCGHRLPGIMITADQSVELAAELAREGMAHLTKPLRPARLFESIGALLA